MPSPSTSKTTKHASNKPTGAEEIIEEKTKREFLADLPPNTNQYKYPGSWKKLEDIMHQEYTRFDDHKGSQFVVFTHISPAQFNQRPEKSLRADYIPNILIIKIKCTPLEILNGEFSSGQLGIKTHDMGVRDLVTSTGSTTFGDENERAKEPDSSFVARLPRGGGLKWPNVVIEAIYSESTREKTIRDVAFWLNKTEGQVTMAVSIEVNRSSWDVTFSGWRAGAPATRHRPDPAPKEVSRMTLTKAEGKGQRPSATGDDLVIPFYDLCHRQPRPNTLEGDFVFTKEEILDSKIAEKVWGYMEDARRLKKIQSKRLKCSETRKLRSEQRRVTRDICHFIQVAQGKWKFS